MWRHLKMAHRKKYAELNGLGAGSSKREAPQKVRFTNFVPTERGWISSVTAQQVFEENCCAARPTSHQAHFLAPALNSLKV